MKNIKIPLEDWETNKKVQQIIKPLVDAGFMTTDGIWSGDKKLKRNKDFQKLIALFWKNDNKFYDKYYNKNKKFK